MKLVQERVGNTWELIGIGNNFLNKIQVAQQLRERIDKWDFMKLKKFLQNKRNGHQIEEAAHRMGENHFQLYIWQKVNNQNIQGPQITKLPQNSMTQ
jgi:hypothetical protein